MHNFQIYKRRTNLSLRALSQILVALNSLNFPASQQMPAKRPGPSRTRPTGMSDEQVIHALAEAQRANNHCLL